jgi:hypothetical protein
MNVSDLPHRKIIPGNFKIGDMTMKMCNKIFVTIPTLVTFILLAGCASTGKDLVRDNTVEIEKVPSQWAALRFVTVVQDGDKIELRGEVTRRPTGRGPIPGHIDLEVIGPDGIALETSTIDYHRGSVKSRYAIFHTTLKTAPPGSTIRVTHDNRAVFSCERLHCE